MNGLLRYNSFSKILIGNNRLLHKTNINFMGKGVHAEEERISPFTFKGLLKHYELIPLVAIMGIGIVGITGYIVYCCKTRYDVSFWNKNKRPYETMDLLNPPVLKMIKSEYKPLTELDSLLKEMAAEEEKQMQQKHGQKEE